MSDDGLVDRLSKQGEEALGKIAGELVANPVVSAAVAKALDARERAVAAQEAAMGVLGIPSAADVERLTRRLRSVSQRLEGIEDSLDRVEERLGATSGDTSEAVAQRITEIGADIAALRSEIAPDADPPPRAQGRLTVTDA
ncbi:MAG: hypothetical protein H0U42_07145 [Thermoleophilaceae bacterium]|nr:hypothetical protein [Thermoleophilaceae bacterium]